VQCRWGRRRLIVDSGECTNIMGNENGLEGDGEFIITVTGVGAMSSLPWLTWHLQPLEGQAKGAACWKV
jgi:hypothetical protein